jgi:hypothetical protein
LIYQNILAVDPFLKKSSLNARPFSMEIQMRSAKSILSQLFFILAVLLLPLTLAAAEDPKAPPAKEVVQKQDAAPAGQECKGKVNDMGGFGFRKLPCDGTCSPGVSCDWQTETKPNGDKRSWCGCPNQPEPSYCHLAVIEPNQGAPSTECKGTCDPGKTCKEKKKANPDGTNDISCECS